METKKYSINLFLGQVLGIAFLCLKLCGVIDWSWAWILIPIVLSAFFEPADFMPYAVALTILKLCGVTTVAWGWILLIIALSVATGLVDYYVKSLAEYYSIE